MRAETSTTPEATSAATGKRRAWTPSRRAVLLGLVPAAAIAAACGSSSTNSSTNTTNSATTGSTASGPPAVQTANNATLGTILVDSQGRTLYTLTNNGAAVACSGQCLTIWPPALLPAGQTTVSAGPGVSNVTAVSGSNGTQVAYKGLPLYRFSRDTTAGAATGEGINSFGGVWHVVKVSGGSTGAGTPGGGTATTGGGGGATTTTSGGGGYGY